MAIEFGQLQSIKAKGLMAKGAQANQQKANIEKAQSVFEEYEKYKSQLGQAQENGGETGSTTSVAFGSTSMSVSELEAKMAECENEFKQYYATMNDKSDTKPEQSGENEDEKNKVKPKEFSGLMA